MVFVVYIIIASCGTEVPAIHLIFGLTIKTTLSNTENGKSLPCLDRYTTMGLHHAS